MLYRPVSTVQSSTTLRGRGLLPTFFTLLTAPIITLYEQRHDCAILQLHIVVRPSANAHVLAALFPIPAAAQLVEQPLPHAPVDTPDPEPSLWPAEALRDRRQECEREGRGGEVGDVEHRERRVVRSQEQYPRRELCLLRNR